MEIGKFFFLINSIAKGRLNLPFYVSVRYFLGVNTGKLYEVTYAVDDTINLPYGITIICCNNYQDSMIAIMRMPVCMYKIVESTNNYSTVLDIIQTDAYSNLSVKIKYAGTYTIAFLGQ